MKDTVLSKVDEFKKETVPVLGEESVPYEDDLVKLLKDIEVQYFDFRTQKGQLWIYDNPENLYLIIQLLKFGIKAKFNLKGNKNVTTKRSWSIKRTNIDIPKNIYDKIIDSFKGFIIDSTKIYLKDLNFDQSLNNNKADKVIKFFNQYGLRYKDYRTEKNQIRIILDDVNKVLKGIFQQKGLTCDFAYDHMEQEGYRSYWVIKTLAEKNKRTPLTEKELVKVITSVKPKTTIKSIKKPQKASIEDELAKFGSLPMRMQDSEILIKELINKGIDYVDHRYIDGKLWLVKSDSSKRLINKLVLQKVDIFYDKIYFPKGIGVTDAYGIRVEDNGSKECTINMRKLPVRSLSKINRESAKSDKRIKRMLIEPNQFIEIVKGIKDGNGNAFGDSDIFVDEEGLDEKVYSFLEKSRQEFPEGLTAGFIAEALREEKDRVKEILNRSPWARKRGIHYIFDDSEVQEEYILDYDNLPSLAFTRPVLVNFSSYGPVTVSSWKEVLAVVSYGLYKGYEKDFLNLIKFSYADKFVDHYHLHKLEVPCNIGGDCWIDLQRSPGEIALYLYKLMKMCGVSGSTVKIIYKYKN